jgi:hypothetical protein
LTARARRGGLSFADHPSENSNHEPFFGGTPVKAPSVGFLLVGASLLSAQSSFPPAPGASFLTVSPAGGHYTEPGIAINPKDPNQVVVVFQGGKAEQGSATAAFSHDAGRTFTLAQGTQSPAWRVGGDVSTTFDNKGSAYLCYLVFDRLGTASYWAHGAGRNGILVTRSPDGGKTWVPSVTVKAFNTGHEADLQFEDEPRIFADNNAQSPYAGNLYVGWVEWQLTQSVMFLSRSTDSGKTWSAPLRVSTHPGLPRDDNGSLGGFVLTTSGDGSIYAVWDDGNTIAMTVSKDGGQTFAPSHPVLQVAPPYFGEVPGVSRVEGFPQIALDGKSGTMYVCWSDYRNGDVDVFIASSQENSATWSDPVRVNNDPIHDGKDQFYQWMTVDPATGAVYVQFYDRRADPKNIMTGFTLARSLDHGRTFENYAWMTNAFNPGRAFLGDYTWMAALNGKVFGAWTQSVPAAQTGATRPTTVIVVGTADFNQH